MNIDQQVCSLELAKRLYELGVKQESLFFWRDVTYNEGVVIPEKILAAESHMNKSGNIYEYYSAYTVAELGAMLPDNCYTQKDNAELKQVWVGRIEKKYDNEPCFIEEKESDARAKTIIYLIESKLIEVPK